MLELRGRQMRRARFFREHDEGKAKAAVSLKAAFKYELRPADYFLRVWLTALVAGAFLVYQACSRQGQFDLSFIFPPSGQWQARDHFGGLYLETWANIIVNAWQTGLIIWASVLLFLGLYRLMTSHKHVFACFYLGLFFLGFAHFLPGWVELFLRMLIQKCPALSG